MKARQPRRGARILRVVGWVLLGLVLALYLGLPTVMAIAAVWPSRANVGAPPDGFASVTLATTDGVKLSAWYAESKNGAAVILTHGAGASRSGVKRQADMLVKHGYGVLAIDLRGHGTSDGATNRLGWRGTRDVEAAVEYLRAQPGVRAIGALGESMGAEVLLGASGECPEIRAIVADGATRRCTEELLALPSERPLVRNFTARVFYGAVGLFTWSSPPEPLLEEMRSVDSTSYLFIAAGAEDLEVAFSEMFAREMGERADLWVAEGVAHTAAVNRYPDEYERHIIGFFDDHLSGAGAAVTAE